jgi:hypothetical protein
MTTWQIKGTTSVTGLVPANASVSVTVKFQKKANGATDWSDMFSVTQSTNGVNGTATIDTGFNPFSPAPNSGDQYRVVVSGYYIDSNGKQVQLTPVGSTPVTPVP